MNAHIKRCAEMLPLITAIQQGCANIDRLQLQRTHNLCAALQRGLERLANMSEAERITWFLGGSKK